jgi:ribosomal protein S17E
MQFFYLENNKRVSAERVSPVQEEKLKSVSTWLNNFMNENKIKNLYLLNGGDITDKYVRRIWMYLDKKYNFYCFTKDFNNNDKIELFDTITYKFKEPKEISGVFLHTKSSLDNAFLPAGFRAQMIKEEPEVYLYFFIPDN